VRTTIGIIAGAVATLAAIAPARAAVDRFGVVLGNDLGARDEPRLRFAETDAVKLHDALKEIGGFSPENLVLLRGESPAVARSALIAVNARVRESIAAGRQVVLLVYYSGHADAEALHLGDGRLSLREIEELVRGSSANVRLLVLDACRSGALTQAKGGTRAPPFPVEIDQRLTGEGAIFLTSSAVNEEAQESSAIGGSFFTHYFVSGLLGAADQNEDGQISIDEAYRFAYDSTLRASSRSLIGTQHPTFRYDLRGQGTLGLTFPFRDAERAQIRFPAGVGFLVLRENGDGAVVAEVGLSDQVRRLSLKPGRYFVRGRGRDYLLEGTVALTAGPRPYVVQEGNLERVEYARLVRKGGGQGKDRAAVSLEAGLALATSAWSGAGLCRGGFAGGSLALARLTLGLRLGACRARDDRLFLEAVADNFEAQVRASLEWDLRPVTLGVGVNAGAAFLHQQFETTGVAPSRWSAGGTLGAAARLMVPLGRRPFLLAELSAETLLIRKERDADGGSRFAAIGGGHVLAGAGAHLW
jgi:hypothetical protein